MRALRWVVVYGFVATIALWAAMNLTFKFLGPAQAQSEFANSESPQNFQVEDTGTTAVPNEMLESSGEGVVENVNSPESFDNTPGMESQGEVPAPPMQAIDEVTGEGMTAPVEKQVPSDSETFYNYIAEGKRDPFEPFRKIKASLSTAKGGGGLDNRADDELEPLERWELDRIKIVAILWDISNPRAVVMTPDGITHLVNKGAKIGRNFGVIKDIREGAIVVAEKIFIEGNAKTEIQVMELR